MERKETVRDQTVADPGARSPGNLAGLAIASTAWLAACGGGGGGGSDGGQASAVAGSSATAGLGTAVAGYQHAVPASDNDAARFLQQAQFSASDAEIAAVRDQGYAAWLSAKLNAPATQSAVDWQVSRGYTAVDTRNFFDHTYVADFALWNQLIKSGDAVRKRLALALSEFFVMSMNGQDFEFRGFASGHYWDLLVKGTRGNFRSLLEEVTLRPSMGDFLNTRGSQNEDSQGRLPDENYAREVMQLFTIGLHELNIDGTEKLAEDGSKRPSYVQSDVSNLARVFTGWNFDSIGNVNTTVYYATNSRVIGSYQRAQRPMTLTESRHSTLTATFLGATVPANTGGVQALKIGLDTLFNHPNVGPFFGRQMIQRLVTSNPSPAYVARVAAVFNNNGEGVRGDLKSVFAAVLLDNEARGAAGLTDPSFGKVREPMVRFVQWARTFGLESAAGSWKLESLANNSAQLGQSPLRAGSVFNFFRPGYVPPSTALAASKKVAPEFQIVNESTVGGYLNFMQNCIRNGFNAYSPDVPELNYQNPVRDLVASYASVLPLVLDAAALVAKLNLLLCAGQLPAASVSLMVNALNATPVTAASASNLKLDRVAAAVLMVMASGSYLVQK
ncbi:MAG: DUF1800 domain-containing protein [Polaromonas sp.]|nr:DUF1800 domain-containing protein [Polaromonas sp.]